MNPVYFALSGVFGAIYLIGFFIVDYAMALTLSPELSLCNSVVEVHSTQAGSGLLVLLDKELAILTTSHLLRGSPEAKIRLDAGFFQFYDFRQGIQKGVKVAFESPGQVIQGMDFPIADFVFIRLLTKLPEDLSTVLHHIGSENARFCTRNFSDCNGRALPRFLKTARVCAMIDGTSQQINLVQPGQAKRVEDKFISGSNHLIYSLPIYLRTGFSGGGFYQDGRLTGLVSKVSTVGEPLSFAIPLANISTILLENRFNDFGSWILPPGTLRFLEKGEELITELSTGSTANAGGETNNGGEIQYGSKGGESGNGNPGQGSKYWKITYGDISGAHLVEIVDPFVFKSPLFKINGKEVAYLEIGEATPALPTMALFRWFKRNSPHQIKPIYLNDLPTKTLGTHQIFPASTLKTGRVYRQEKDSDVYTVYRAMGAGRDRDGSQYLYPNAAGAWPKPDATSSASVFSLLGSRAVLDEQGYYLNYPVSARLTPDRLLDVKVLGKYFLGLKESGHPGVFGVDIPSNLEWVRLKPFDQPEITLLPLTGPRGRIIFEAKESPYRAVIIFNATDLRQLERIFIQLDRSILEFSGCEAGQECVR